MTRKMTFWIGFCVASFAVMSMGCATKTVRLPDGSLGTKRVLMPQVGVTVSVVNNCAPLLDVVRSGVVLFSRLAYGELAAVPLVSSPLGGRSRRMPLTVRGYMENSAGEVVYLGSATKTFSVNTSQGSEEEVWEVDRLRRAGSRGGCSEQ